MSAASVRTSGREQRRIRLGAQAGRFEVLVQDFFELVVGRFRIRDFASNAPPVSRSLIRQHADSLTAQISSRITRSDYFCSFGVANTGSLVLLRYR